MRIEITGLGDSERRFVEVPEIAASAAAYVGVQALPRLPGPARFHSRVRFPPGPGISWSNLTVAAAEGRRHGRRVRTNR